MSLARRLSLSSRTVARVERSVTRGGMSARETPDCAALHPGYKPAQISWSRTRHRRNARWEPSASIPTKNKNRKTSGCTDLRTSCPIAIPTNDTRTATSEPAALASVQRAVGEQHDRQRQRRYRERDALRLDQIVAAEPQRLDVGDHRHHEHAGRGRDRAVRGAHQRPEPRFGAAAAPAIGCGIGRECRRRSGRCRAPCARVRRPRA